MKRLIVIGSIFLSGCISDLDRKMMTVRQDAYNSQKIFIQLVRTYDKGASEAVNKKFVLEKTVIDNDWKIWLDRHTDENGGLVSRMEDGRIVPMPVEQLTKAMAQRDGALKRMIEGEKEWIDFRETFNSSLARMEAMYETLYNKEIEIQETKESVQAAWDAVLNSLGSIAGGLGIGALSF